MTRGAVLKKNAIVSEFCFSFFSILNCCKQKKKQSPSHLSSYPERTFECQGITWFRDLSINVGLASVISILWNNRSLGDGVGVAVAGHVHLGITIHKEAVAGDSRGGAGTCQSEAVSFLGLLEVTAQYRFGWFSWRELTLNGCWTMMHWYYNYIWHICLRHPYTAFFHLSITFFLKCGIKIHCIKLPLAWHFVGTHNNLDIRHPYISNLCILNDNWGINNIFYGFKMLSNR